LEQTIWSLKIIVRDDPSLLGKEAGQLAGETIREAIKKRGRANIVLATGTSQFETLRTLTQEDIEWSQVNMFHLDEYIGLPESSPASFRKYLKERFVEVVSTLKDVHFINGESDPVKECLRLGKVIKKNQIDVALIGIGENGHIAFNDPPADFETEEPFIIVDLDATCRRQQYQEGWFNHIDEVPEQAITMSVKQIMKSAKIICSVPERRKAEAIRDCFENPVSPLHPASILQTHSDCICFLDKYSSLLLNKQVLESNKK
jgi:glucosamine-6-phosphate deaminase